MTVVHLVNHTHWDREWYFTTMDSQVLSDSVFTEVLDELENHSEANFCFDGQSSIVDEYVAFHPESITRIRGLVKKGQLFIGPWYTQTDALLPDAESILRNLAIGLIDTRRKYGVPMMVGYLPDTFGFNPQLPTLLHAASIDNFVFWRGTDYEGQLSSPYFNWKGLGSQSVIAANFPFGYFTGQITPESKAHLSQFVTKRYDPAIDFFVRLGNADDVLMPSGIDQMNIIHNIQQTIDKINKISKFHTIIDSYPSFISLLRTKKLPSYQGELRLPRYARVHRTIGSVRYRIKQQNYDLEQKILHRVEPLMVIGNSLGLHVGTGLLVKLWKLLLSCQAHDTIGGCVSDDVTIDIMHRFKVANELADGIENVIKKKIAQSLQLTEQQVLIVNTSPHVFKGRKTVEILSTSKNIQVNEFDNQIIENVTAFPERNHVMMLTSKGKSYGTEPEYYRIKISGTVSLPGMGYRILNLQKKAESLEKWALIPGANSISLEGENQVLSFENGDFILRVEGKTIKKFLEIVDSGNDGDTYDYSPLADDIEQGLDFQNASVYRCGKNEFMLVRGSSVLPQNLEEREKGIKSVDVHYQLKLYFDDDKCLQAELTFGNKIKSHRLRVRLQSGIAESHVISRCQLGYCHVTNQKISQDWQNVFDEKPVNIFNFDKTISVINTHTQLTFLASGQKEFQFTHDALYITLMSTTGQLGKPNLKWRPGRASGDTTNQGHVMMSTPLAQELGDNRFKFAIRYANKPFHYDENEKLVNRYLNQNVDYQLQNLNLFVNRLDNKIWDSEITFDLPKRFELLNLDFDMNIAAIYPSFTCDDAFVVRLQNPTGDEIPIDDQLIQRATFIDVSEQEVAATKVISSFDTVSLMFNYKDL